MRLFFWAESAAAQSLSPGSNKGTINQSSEHLLSSISRLSSHHHVVKMMNCIGVSVLGWRRTIFYWIFTFFQTTKHAYDIMNNADTSVPPLGPMLLMSTCRKWRQGPARMAATVQNRDEMQNSITAVLCQSFVEISRIDKYVFCVLYCEYCTYTDDHSM